MFFAKPGEYEACGIFTKKHFVLLIITVILIVIALKKTAHKSKEEVHKIIKKLTIILLVLEVIKIAFVLQFQKLKDVNTYVPLYYCSLLLYAGALSSFAKGKLKRTGDVFLSTGSIIGGTIFMILPTTSLPTYPAIHFVSVHSFFFHGTMVYLGILVNKTHYIKLKKSDIAYFAGLVGVICIMAYIVNKIFDSNLMFISKNFPRTPVELLYNGLGPLFTPVMCIGQMTLPFYIVYGILKLIERRNKNVKRKIIRGFKTVNEGKRYCKKKYCSVSKVCNIAN